ncbi:MAG: hypothetical protein OJF51_002404 [Nitrospira sp.]|jgi:hypothetical protein|nr:MAG: hypothetical protein OJF51_002404 [Nitrospira sp.]
MANRLALELVADNNPFIKAMEQAQRTLDRFTDGAESAGQAIGGSLGKALDNFMNFSKGGAAAAAGAVALTASAAEQVDKLDQLSQKTGIALKTLQSWSVIMAENDIQAESLTTAMKTLSSKMVEAKDPASKAAAAFDEMGLSVNELGSTESVIRALSDRFKSMPDGADKARLAIEFLGKAGLDLIPMLNEGSEAFDESMNAAQRFGAQLSDLQNKALKQADKALDDLGVAANALKLNLGSVFAPTVKLGAELLAEALGFLAHVAREVDVALDTLAIRITHIGLAAKELGSVLFSREAFSSGAWKQALNNISLINKEAEKLIKVRRAIDALDKEPVLQVPEVKVTATKLIGQGPDQNSHVVDFRAEQHAQEALGKVLNEMHNTKMAAMRAEEAERNKLFAQMVMEEDRVRLLNEELSKPPTSGPFVEAIEAKEAAVRGLLNIMPELTREQAIAMAADQIAKGTAELDKNKAAWLRRNDALEMAVDHAKVLDEAQQAMFQTEGVLFGNSENAIRARMQLIDAEGALRKRKIEESIFDEKRRAAELENLDIELNTKRRQAIQSYPSFFQQQMKAIVDSNAFSISQITTTWTSGLANAAVNGGNFVEQAWKSTQMAVLQGFLNLGVQILAREAVTASVRLGIISSAAAAEMGINTAKNATIVAGDAAAATATVGIWEGAGIAITGTFGAITGAITGFFSETIIPMFATIGDILMTFLSSIAGAASSTIFGIPYAVAIMAGVAIIGAAIGALMAFAFADGGIVTGPTLGMVGEAGSSEAVIPLNKRGASFMRDVFGGGGQGGPVTIITELDGRAISKSVVKELPSVLRLRGVSA